MLRTPAVLSGSRFSLLMFWPSQVRVNERDTSKMKPAAALKVREGVSRTLLPCLASLISSVVLPRRTNPMT